MIDVVQLIDEFMNGDKLHTCSCNSLMKANSSSRANLLASAASCSAAWASKSYGEIIHDLKYFICNWDNVTIKSEIQSVHQIEEFRHLLFLPCWGSLGVCWGWPCGIFCLHRGDHCADAEGELRIRFQRSVGSASRVCLCSRQQRRWLRRVFGINGWESMIMLHLLAYHHHHDYHHRINRCKLIFTGTLLSINETIFLSHFVIIPTLRVRGISHRKASYSAQLSSKACSYWFFLLTYAMKATG